MVTTPQKSQSSSSSSASIDEVDTSFGIGGWRPACLQRFSKPIYFMINLSLVGAIQGMVYTLFFSSISSLEKRYGFDSKISGIILILDDLIDMLCNPIVGYYGIRFNRARMIAWGFLLLSASCFLIASPYFIYGHAEHLLTHDPSTLTVSNTSYKYELCAKDGSNFSDCSSLSGKGGNDVTVWPAVYILFAGSLLYGLGYTCYFVIGLPYLDDNIKKDQSPIYIAVFTSVRLVGPALGYMLSAYCLKFYENPFIDPGFSQKDPRFVGAWWMSFCIIGVVLFFTTLPLFCFPAQFKSATVDTVEVNKKLKQSGGSMAALKRILRNPLVVFFILGNIFRATGLGGFLVFKSKYIESQYRQSASSASFLSGFSSFAPMSIGIMLGGLVIAYLKPKPKNVLILVFLVESVSIFSIGSGLFLGCDPIEIAGGFKEDGLKFSPQTNCNQNCDCSTRVYAPICAPDGNTNYFSPCFAGCSTAVNNSKLFKDCSCFNGTGSVGFCKSETKTQKCTSNLYKYMAIITVGNIVSAFARAPNSLIALRSVDPMDKGFAIGFASCVMDIFAYMQYPVLFGYITDAACLIWDDKCGKTGNCWFYNNEKFRTYFIGAAVVFASLGSLFDLLMVLYADRIQNFYDKDGKEDVDSKANNDSNQIEMN